MNLRRPVGTEWGWNQRRSSGGRVTTETDLGMSGPFPAEESGKQKRENRRGINGMKGTAGGVGGVGEGLGGDEEAGEGGG